MLRKAVIGNELLLLTCVAFAEPETTIIYHRVYHLPIRSNMSLVGRQGFLDRRIDNRLKFHACAEMKKASLKCPSQK